MAVNYKSRTAILRIVRALAIFNVLPLALSLYGQTTATPTQKPCTGTCPAPVPAAKKSNAEQFPFPGEAGKSAESNTPGTDLKNSPAPGSNSPTYLVPAPSSAGQFPYPGEPTSAGDSSSSSSSSPTDADVEPDQPPQSTDAEKPTRRRLPKVKKLQSDEDRESDDITIARFYRDRGNWTAAYRRSKDAVKHQPDDPEAHLLLAETAFKLDKREEAIAEYGNLLKLDASEVQIKAARKALIRLEALSK